MRRAITIIILTTFVLGLIVGSIAIAEVAILTASGFFEAMDAPGAFIVMVERIAVAFALLLDVLDVFKWIALAWEFLKLMGLR
jgi:hypothetical protein